MASSEEQQQSKMDSDQSLKLAVAMALLRSKLLQKPPPPPSSSLPPNSDAQKWKRKAKERKMEILRLKEDLKEAEDGLQHDLFPESASCKCYFFDHLGKLSPKQSGDGLDRRFNDVLRRRFLRQVRLKERRRKRRNSSSQGLHFSVLGDNIEEQTEHLKASVDFLVDLCETVQSQEDTKFANWSHQAVDFILAALKNLLSTGKLMEHVEGVVSSLITRLCRRMCPELQGDDIHQFDADAQLYVQHLLRKLGSESCIGQRVILAVSERISVLAEKLLSIDPFDEAFPDMHYCMYIFGRANDTSSTLRRKSECPFWKIMPPQMPEGPTKAKIGLPIHLRYVDDRIQLVEFLVSDYLLTWSNTEGFETSLFEEWLTSMLHARKRLDLFESRDTLYTLYIDRVMGLVAKQVNQIPLLQKLNPNILESLFQ